MSILRRCLVLWALLTALLGVAPKAEAATIDIIGNTVAGPDNCIPFGGFSNAYMGFVYKNIPAFSLGVGDTISFDLGLPNDVVIRMELAMATASYNGSMQQNGAGFTVVVADGVPAAPTGDAVIGNFDLTYTATAPFVFTGGGLIIRFKPLGSMALDFYCNATVMYSQSYDTSGLFVGRFYTDGDGVYPWTGWDTVVIGVVRIVTGSTPGTATVTATATATRRARPGR